MNKEKGLTEPLVSIVTPCYNGEKFIDNYFKSIKSQTYHNIEIIVVNDGSKDESNVLLKKYEKELLDKGYNFKYIEKKNEGQMKAVQDGILLTNGEYLTWPDIDDIMEPTYIEDKVTYLINHPDVDIVVNPSNIYHFSDLEKVISQAWSSPFKSKKEVVKRFMLDKDAGYMPGSFMVRYSSFLEIYPDKRFFCDLRAGVAIPLVFPFIYCGKAAYYSKALYKYFVHPNNQHSVNELRDINNLEILYDNVIRSMDISEQESNLLKNIIKTRCSQLRLGYAYRHKDKKAFKQIKTELKEMQGYRVRDRVKGILLFLGIIKK